MLNLIPHNTLNLKQHHVPFCCPHWSSLIYISQPGLILIVELMDSPCRACQRRSAGRGTRCGSALWCSLKVFLTCTNKNGLEEDFIKFLALNRERSVMRCFTGCKNILPKILPIGLIKNSDDSKCFFYINRSGFKKKKQKTGFQARVAFY